MGSKTMREQVLDAKNEGFLNGVVHTAGQVAKAGLQVDRLKDKVTNAFEDGMVDARRMVKRGRYAAEDLIEDTTHKIKKEPWASVGITFGVGVVFGATIGWLVGHKCKAE